MTELSAIAEVYLWNSKFLNLNWIISVAERGTVWAVFSLTNRGQIEGEGSFIGLNKITKKPTPLLKCQKYYFWVIDNEDT